MVVWAFRVTDTKEGVVNMAYRGSKKGNLLLGKGLGAWLRLFLAILLIYVVLEVILIILSGRVAFQVIENYKNYQELRMSIAKAKELWNKGKASSYKESIILNNIDEIGSGMSLNNGSCGLLSNNDLEVKDNVVVSGSDLRCLPTYKWFTVEGTFDIAEKMLNESNPLFIGINIDFDTQYGYIRDLKVEHFASIFAIKRPIEEIRVVKFLTSGY